MISKLVHAQYPSVCSVYRSNIVPENTQRIFYYNSNNVPINATETQKGKEVYLMNPSPNFDNIDESEEQGDFDSIHSGESLIKHFVFDTSKYDKQTDKCVAFWRTIMNETNLKPIKCKDKTKCTQKCTNRTNKTENLEPQYVWYRTLLELQKRKMDQVALSAIDKECHFCLDVDASSAKFKQKQDGLYSESELKDYEDLKQLDNWVSKSLPKSSKQIPKATSEITTSGIDEEECYFQQFDKLAEDVKVINQWPEEECMNEHSTSEIIFIKRSSTPKVQDERINEPEDLKNRCPCGEKACDCLHIPDKPKLVKCNLCQGECKCAELDEQFLEELRFNLKRQEKLKNKACETDEHVLREQFCVCEHNNCNHEKSTERIENLIKIEAKLLVIEPKLTESQIRIRDKIDMLLKHSSEPQTKLEKCKVKINYVSSDEDLKQAQCEIYSEPSVENLINFTESNLGVNKEILVEKEQHTRESSENLRTNCEDKDVEANAVEVLKRFRKAEKDRFENILLSNRVSMECYFPKIN